AEQAPLPQEKSLPPWRQARFFETRTLSAGSVRGRRRRVVLLRRAALGHELVELGLVLGEAQPLQELLELALLVLEPAQRLGAVFVERRVAARRRLPEAVTARAFAHPVHLRLHPLHLVLPALRAAIASASHRSAPYHERQCREAERPPQHEGNDDDRDHRRFRPPRRASL